MTNFNMLFAGFGGQGVLFSGKVAAYAGLIDNKEISWLPSYGPEMRGGTANCSVCIADTPIGSPLVTEPDILIAMNGPSFDKFIDTVKPGGMVILDASLISQRPKRTDIKVFAVEASQLANDHDLQGIANIILLGKLLKESGFTGLDSIEAALKKCVPARKEHLLVHNMRAIKLGMEQ